MKILYITAEADPFVKTGGLADVAGSLPQAIKKFGHDIRVCMPLFGQIPEFYRMEMKKIAYFYVDLGWKHEYCGVWEREYRGVTFYFLDNEYYFKRKQIYGEEDDMERFTFFSKACTQLPKIIGFSCEIFHANDWHSALVPVFLNDYRSGDSFYKPIRSLFTIHNLKYQGIFSLDAFHWTNLPAFYASDYDLKFYNSINLLKGAIVHSNRVNTVSNTYADEIHYPFFAESLENVIQHYGWKISGILNGIDYSIWRTKDNPHLPYSYGLDDMEGKKKIKAFVQKKYGLEVQEDIPLFTIVSRLTAMKGLDLVRYILEDFLQEDVQLLVLGTGDRSYEEMFQYFAYKYPKKVSANIYYSTTEAHQIYAAGDFYLMPSISEPCGISQMIAMRYGNVPIVREAGGLRDSVESYNKYEKTGEGLSFSNINAHDLLETLYRAITLYWLNEEDYKMLQRNSIEKDLSWDRSSKKYVKLYQSLWQD